MRFASLVVSFVTASLLVLTAPSLAHRRTAVRVAPRSATQYSVRTFATGTRAYDNPDAIVVTPTGVYVAYQNATKPDGSDGGFSTIVQYRVNGSFVRSINLQGHCDGLRLNPRATRIWALLNNDANPKLATFDTSLGTIDRFTFSSAPHGGGYDDLAFVGDQVFISGSNPTLNAAGVNVHPALYQVHLSGAVAVVTPVLYGNATATDYTTGKPVTLNEVDPDSLSVDPAGDVVLVNQAGSELVFVQRPGTAQQAVFRVPVGTQLDDTVFAYPTPGIFYVVDLTQNAVYIVSATYVPGTLFTVAPSDSGVASFLGTVNLNTGTVTPVVLGFTNPTGLVFVPGAK